MVSKRRNRRLAKSARTTYLPIPGVHVQWPWSRMLANGEKTVETRGYPIPAKYLNCPLALIETPGPKGKRSGVPTARIIAIVWFSSCFEYLTQSEWERDVRRHCVQTDDKRFSYRNGKKKWGWEVTKMRELPSPHPPPARRGIVYARNCNVPSKLIG